MTKYYIFACAILLFFLTACSVSGRDNLLLINTQISSDAENHNISVRSEFFNSGRTDLCFLNGAFKEEFNAWLGYESPTGELLWEVKEIPVSGFKPEKASKDYRTFSPKERAIVHSFHEYPPQYYAHQISFRYILPYFECKKLSSQIDKNILSGHEIATVRSIFSQQENRTTAAERFDLEDLLRDWRAVGGSVLDTGWLKIDPKR